MELRHWTQPAMRYAFVILALVGGCTKPAQPAAVTKESLAAAIEGRGNTKTSTINRETRAPSRSIPTVAKTEPAAITHTAPWLGDVSELSDKQAEELAKHWGWLELDGVTVLSVAAAEALGKHRGMLSLDGLTELSDDQARALAHHEGPLSLDGLETLSNQAAESLVMHDGPLSLLGLTTLPETAAALLKGAEQITLPERFRR